MRNPRLTCSTSPTPSRFSIYLSGVPTPPFSLTYGAPCLLLLPPRGGGRHFSSKGLVYSITGVSPCRSHLGCSPECVPRRIDAGGPCAPEASHPGGHKYHRICFPLVSRYQLPLAALPGSSWLLLPPGKRVKSDRSPGPPARGQAGSCLRRPCHGSKKVVSCSPLLTTSRPLRLGDV